MKSDTGRIVLFHNEISIVPMPLPTMSHDSQTHSLFKQYQEQLAIGIKRAYGTNERPLGEYAMMVSLTFYLPHHRSVKGYYSLNQHCLEDYIEPVMKAASGVIWEDMSNICGLTVYKLNAFRGTSVMITVEALADPGEK